MISVRRPTHFGFVFWLAAATGAMIVLLASSASLLLARGQVARSSLAAPVLALVAVLGGLFLLRRRIDARTIRMRLRAALVLLVLLPALAISIGSVALGYINGRNQAVNQLQSIAALRELQLTTWSQSLQDVLSSVVNEEFGQARARVALDISNSNQYSELYSAAMRTRMRIYANESADIVEIMLIDLEGRIALSTDREREGQVVPADSFPIGVPTDSFLWLPFRASNTRVWPDSDWAFAARTVVGDNGAPLGLIAARVGLASVAEILGERTSLGTTGRVSLMDPVGAITAALHSTGPAVTTVVIQRVGSEPDLETRVGRSGIFAGAGGARVFAAYRRLAGSDAVLVVEQGFSEALSIVYAGLVVNAGVALLAVLLASLGAFLITRSITSPLVDLVDTAGRIAHGDLDREASVQRNDEVGALAVAFNAMTARLRDLIANLELRVSDRTRALSQAMDLEKRRATRLEAGERVSRDITSILPNQDLLSRLVSVIREAFRFRQVKVYLLDGDRLTLRAGTDVPGQGSDAVVVPPAFLAEQAMRENRAMTSQEACGDANGTSTEPMPNAGAGLALPLRLGAAVVGVLEVLRDPTDAFEEEQGPELQRLADQVAMAIENHRLQKRSRELAVMEERTRLARDLHDSVVQSLYSLNLLAESWRDRVDSDGRAGTRDYPERVVQITQQALNEMRLMVHELRPDILKTDGLLGALHQRLAMVESRSGITARVEADELVDLPVAVSEGLYWIAVEALNNTLKHSSAGHVTVRLYRQAERIILEVSDDGRGFEYPPPLGRGGVGLSTMADRARAMDGRLEIITGTGLGTAVRVAVRVDAQRIDDESR